jgi:hypothetical protein
LVPKLTSAKIIIIKTNPKRDCTKSVGNSPWLCSSATICSKNTEKNIPKRMNMQMMGRKVKNASQNLVEDFIVKILSLMLLKLQNL